MYQVFFRAGDDKRRGIDRISEFVAQDVQDLNNSISGVEMDNGNVLSVRNMAGNEIRPEEIEGCTQTMSW